MTLRVGCYIVFGRKLKIKKEEKIKTIEREGQDPKIEKLPEGNIPLFFGKITDIQGYGYCVIFGPPESINKTENLVEIGLHSTKCQAAFGPQDEDGRIDIYPVKHDHKYLQGGGMVETEMGGIGFRPVDDEKRSFYEGRRFQKVYLAL